MPKSRKPPARKRRKIVTTVSLDPEVVDYLTQLQREFDRDRSYILAAMVQEFRRRRSVPQAIASTSEAFVKQLSA